MPKIVSIIDLGFENNVKPIPEITEEIPLSSVNQEIPDTALDHNKFSVIVGIDGGKIKFFPERNIGFEAEAPDASKIFQIYVSGDDVGDIIIANYDGDQGMKYDYSEDIFDFKGTIKGITFVPPLALEYGENLAVGDSLSTIHSDAAHGTDITVTQDTYVSEPAPNTNYDSATIITVVTQGAPNNKRILFKFGSGFPSDLLRIVSFDLVMNVTSGGTGTIQATAISSSWTSSTVTWNTKPSASGGLGTAVAPASGTFTIPCTVADTATDYTISDNIKNNGIQLTGQGIPNGANVEALEHAGTDPAYITNLIYVGRDGKVYKSDATYGESANEFVGFCATAGNAGDTDKSILYDGILETTGLTPGSTYYLSDTKGDISTSAGTNSKKVGRAVGATLLMIKNDND